MPNEQEIVTIQKRVIEEKYSSISSPATYINGKRYHFSERRIPDAGMLICLPNEFIDLPSVIAKQKYPSENRPKVIISSADISVNFAFTLLSDAIRDEELIQTRNAALDALKKIYPQNTYLDTGVETSKESRLFTWYEYYGPTLDSESYALNAFMRIKNRLLHYLFNCPKAEYEDWRPIVLETISSIREDQTL